MSVAIRNRGRWLLLSFLLFTGIFASSIAGRVNRGAHIPVRAACRAIGANVSLSSATRNLRSEHKDFSISFVSALFFIFLLALAVPRRATSARLRTKACRRILAILSVPPLLFRPPPVSIAA